MTHGVDAVYCYQPSSVVFWSVTLVSRAKTAVPIKMPFGLRTRMGPGNHVLDVKLVKLERGNFEVERDIPL